MKKKILCAILTLFTSVSLFAESYKGLNAALGYRNNNFNTDDIEFKDKYFPLMLGWNYTYYPSYNSFWGFSINPMIAYNVSLSGESNENINGSNADKYTFSDEGYYLEKEVWETKNQFAFYTDLAVNFRIPPKYRNGFFFLRTGGAFQIGNFSATDKLRFQNKNYYSRIDYENEYSGAQTTFSGVLELGWQPALSEYADFFFGNVSVRFVYDFLTKNPMTDGEFIHPNSFGIMLVCELGAGKEAKKDKEILARYEENKKQKLLAMQANEDRYSKNFKLVEKKDCTVEDIEYLALNVINSDRHFDNSFLEIPVTAEFYRQTTADGNYWLEFSEPFLRDITFIKHTLGNGKVGTEEYITCSEEKITLPFYTEEEKEKAFKVLVEEYDVRQQQKARIAENRRLNPNNYDYQNLPVLSMVTMGVEYAPNPALVQGRVYYAKNLAGFYIINRMDDGSYNIGFDSYYGGYQFILKNSSGETMGGIGGHMFAESAYLKYLGTMEVIMSNGYVRYLPYFEMLKKNPHSKIQNIIEECEKW